MRGIGRAGAWRIILMMRSLTGFGRGALAAGRLLVLPIGVLSASAALAQPMTMPAIPGMTMPTFPGMPGAAIVLTNEQVLAFIESVPVMYPAMDTLDERYNLPATTADNPAATYAAYMQVAPALAELNGIAGQFGFTDFGQWMQVFTTVLSGMAFANPEMTIQERAMITAMMPAGMVPSPENLQIIADNYAALEAVMDMM
jgi:hypothetical protein